MSDARSSILERIHRSTAENSSERAREYASIRREYQISGTLDSAQRLDLFADRLRDYGCRVYECTEVEIAGAIAKILTERGKRRLLIPSQLSATWLTDSFEFVRDDRVAPLAMDASEGVITECAVAVASTGTIVLQHTRGEGRRALTLIPDYHLCVVFDGQIVGTVPEAIRQMRSFEPVPLTTISGPSATSDIEMTRVQGVHGPRTLDVLLVGPPTHET